MPESAVRPSLFRRSLQFRTVSSIVSLSAVALIVLGGFLSYSIGNGLFSNRLEQVLVESERLATQAQNEFVTAGANDEVTLQALVNSVVPNLESVSSAGSRLVALIRSPGQPQLQLLQSPISTQLDASLISPEIRGQVRQSEGQLAYQSIALQQGGTRVPGIVIGAPIEIPIAGSYELYLVYDLANEQQTLDFVQGSLFIGGVILLFAVGTVSFVVSRWLVRPVSNAADVSQQIAEGALALRLPEKGEDELAHLAQNFNRMADSLEAQIKKLGAISKMQQRFVSDVSHELRTPLTTIKLAGDLLYNSREELGDPLRRSVELLNGQLIRFETLLSDLLEISRYDAGAVQANFEQQDLRDAVSKAARSLETLAHTKGSRIQLVMPKHEVTAEFDARRIDRLLRNLVANAVEHGEGKPIRIEVGESENAVAVSVTDKGVGMSRSEVDRVFDRFWRADPARQRTTGGTGLGLSIAQEDANLHGGWLQVWAEPGRGASFRLTLPKRQGVVFTSSPLPLPPKRPIPRVAKPVVKNA